MIRFSSKISGLLIDTVEGDQWKLEPCDYSAAEYNRESDSIIVYKDNNVFAVFPMRNLISISYDLTSDDDEECEEDSIDYTYNEEDTAYIAYQDDPYAYDWES